MGKQKPSSVRPSTKRLTPSPPESDMLVRRACCFCCTRSGAVQSVTPFFELPALSPMTEYDGLGKLAQRD
jgi:hypothetical protein